MAGKMAQPKTTNPHPAISATGERNKVTSICPKFRSAGL